MKRVTAILLMLTLMLVPLNAHAAARNSSIGSIEKFIDTAKGEVGYLETVTGNDSFWSKYGAWYGLPNGAWCAMFISWCTSQSGISTAIIPRFASVQVGVQWFKQRGQWQESGTLPKRGDLIMFGNHAHIGIVEKVQNEKIYTIEGNANDGTGKNYGVREKVYDRYDPKIMGYGVPKYPQDGIGPTISHPKIQQISSHSLKLSCNVNDNKKVKSVSYELFWNNQPSIIIPASLENDAAAATVELDPSKNLDGTCRAWIYAYDDDGNCTKTMMSTSVDQTAPLIQNIRVTEIDTTGYRVECDITDKSKIEKVLFPTWTEYQGQDDLPPDWMSTNKVQGSIKGNRASFRVNTSTHGKESGIYHTLIYAYDIFGNSIEVKVKDTTIPAILPAPKLMIKQYDYKRLKLTWTSITGAKGYELYRSTSKNGIYKKVVNIKNGTTCSFIDQVDTGKTYYYKLKAFQGKLYSKESNISAGKAIPNQVVIRSVSTKKKGHAAITWKVVPGASGYEIYQSSSLNGKYKRIKKISGGKVNFYTTTKTSGKQGYYKIRAYRVSAKKQIFGIFSSIKKIKIIS